MQTLPPVPLEVSLRGAVDDVAVQYARRRIEKVFGQIGEPVLFARLQLTLAADPARERPALAGVVVDIDGTVLRAHVAAHDLREAADLLQRRLLDQVEHRASHLRDLRRRKGITEPGQWRHGDVSLPHDRLELSTED